MLMIEAYCRAKPGMRDELLRHVRVVHEATRRETGCIAYAHYPSADNDQDMFIFEKWDSAAAFDAHRETGHHKEFCRVRRPLLEEGSYSITIWDCEENAEYTRRIRRYAQESMG